MTDVIMERVFDPAVTRAEVQDMAAAAQGCFAIYRVMWQQSFLASDKKRLLCWFDVPDAESGRMALRQAGVSEHVLWPATVHDAAAADAPSWQEANVVVERRWDEPVTLEEIQAIEDAGAACLETHRVRFARTYFSADRLRMACLYQAPDAESVRTAQRQAGMPVTSVWSFEGVRDLD